MRTIFKFFLYLIVLIIPLTYLWDWLSFKELRNTVTIDKIIVEKAKHKLYVLNNGNVLKSYNISLGTNPKGHKTKQGDGRTPEGLYLINDKNPNSAYHLNLGISYPNATDIANARNSKVAPGGDIKIHGLKNGLGFIGNLHLLADWTQGCIAVSNREVEELYDNVSIGTPIEIKP